MSALQKPHDLLHHYLGNSLDPLLSYINSSLLTKALLAVLVISILRSANRTLSSLVVNNWQRQRPWDNNRELVLLTGGCSGIGKQIMLDLAQKGVRVVILDVVEPSFKLRMPSAPYLSEFEVDKMEYIVNICPDITRKRSSQRVLLRS